MKIVDPARAEAAGKFCRQRGGHELACLRVIVQPGELVRQPARDCRAAQPAHPLNGGKAGDRHDARHDFRADPGSGGIVEVQGTAETVPFSQASFDELMGLARKGIGELLSLQKLTVG